MEQFVTEGIWLSMISCLLTQDNFCDVQFAHQLCYLNFVVIGKWGGVPTWRQG